jgi:hypothetical protein
MYAVKINGSLISSNKLGKIEKKHIKQLAKTHHIIKFTITNRVMNIYHHKQPEYLIDFVKDIINYVTTPTQIKYENDIKRMYCDKKTPDGIRGCIDWGHPYDINRKEYIYVNINRYVHLKIDRVPRLIYTPSTVSNIANCFVDGRTVSVFTDTNHDYISNQILKSLQVDTSKTNPLLFQEIRKVFPTGVDAIIFGYATELHFEDLRKQLI